MDNNDTYTAAKLKKSIKIEYYLYLSQLAHQVSVHHLQLVHRVLVPLQQVSNFIVYSHLIDIYFTPFTVPNIFCLNVL